MRVLLCFMYRDTWNLSFLAEDAKTPVGRRFTVPDMLTLLKVVEKLKGSPDRVQTTIYNWGQGSEWVELSEEQCRYFRIRRL